MRSILLILIFSCSLFSQTEEQQIKQLSKDMNYLLITKKYQRALPLANTIYEKITKISDRKDIQILAAMNNIAALYTKQKIYDKAENLYILCLEEMQKSPEKSYSNILSITNELAGLYEEKQQYSKAEKLYLKIIEHQTDKHESVVYTAMNNIARSYQKQKKYSDAEKWYNICLKQIQERIPGNQDLLFSTKNNLAMLYVEEYKYKKAKKVLDECVKIKNKIADKNNIHNLTLMNNFGSLYLKQGEYKKAEETLSSLLKNTTKNNKNYKILYTITNNLSGIYHEQGKYQKAANIFEKLLEESKNFIPDEKEKTLTIMANLANSYKILGKYVKAEILLEECLQTSEELFGKNNIYTLKYKSYLGSLYQKQGKFNKAENMFRAVLDNRNKNLLKNDATIWNSLENLGSLYLLQGKYSEAEALFFESLEMKKSVSLGDDLVYFKNLSSIGSLYKKQKKYDQAEVYFSESLKITTEYLGENHLDTCIAMNNLASLYSYQQKYQQAQDLLRKCLQNCSNNNYSLIKDILGNLALSYYFQKKYSKVEDIFMQSIKKQQEDNNPYDLSIAMRNLFLFYCQQEEHLKAQKLGTKILRDNHNYFSTLFLGTDEYTQRYLISKNKEFSNFYYSLNLQLNNGDSPQNFMLSSLYNKAFTLSISAFLRTTDKQNPEIENIFEELNEKQSLFSHLVLNNTDKLKSHFLLERLSELKEEIDNLTRKLGLLSDKFQRQLQKVKIEDIQTRLGDREAIVDFVIFNKINLKELQYTRRFVAASIILKDKVHLVSIGSLPEIKKILDDYRNSMLKKQAYSKSFAQELYHCIWKPISEHLQNVNNVIIIPDAELHMLPFSSLCDDDNKYLSEKVNIKTCSSLRSFAIKKNHVVTKQDVVIFSNPDYDKKTKMGSKIVDFIRLPGTKEENQNIESMLAKKKISYKSYSEGNATKENIIEIKNPRILHIATHGFYWSPQKEKLPESYLDLNRGTKSIFSFDEKIENASETVIFFDPLAYCGLAFAGANNNSEEGVLLGTEVPSLSLSNTELVVLSACETGVGTTETITSEGKIYRAEEVFSLRRAFEEAGARAVLSTMWPAADDATQQFMTRFYELYLDKVPPQQALRVVQLEFLQSEKYSHPYFWANFVLVGTDKHFPEHTKNFDFDSLKKAPYLNLLYILIVFIFFVLGIILLYFFKLRAKEIEQKRLSRRQKRKNKEALYDSN